MLEKIKSILRIKNQAFDGEVQSLIDGAKAELEMLGIATDESNPLVFRAIATYCRLNFSSPDDYANLKKSYDEQKSQLQMLESLDD